MEPTQAIVRADSESNSESEYYANSHISLWALNYHLKEKWESMFNNSDGAVLWKVFALATTLILLFLFVNSRRRTSKIKI